VRPAGRGDQAATLALADRLAAFGPTTRTANVITSRERRALADAFEHSALVNQCGLNHVGGRQ